MLKWVVTFSAHEDMRKCRVVRVVAFSEKHACDRVVARIRELTRTEKPIYVTAIEDR